MGSVPGWDIGAEQSLPHRTSFFWEGERGSTFLRAVVARCNFCRTERFYLEGEGRVLLVRPSPHLACCFCSDMLGSYVAVTSALPPWIEVDVQATLPPHGLCFRSPAYCCCFVVFVVVRFSGSPRSRLTLFVVDVNGVSRWKYT